MRRAVGLALVALLLSGSPVAAASFAKPSPHPANTPTFSWVAGWGGYVDDRCGASGDVFHVFLYADAQYQGAKTKVCGGVTTFCDVPLIDTPPCSFGHTANDNVTSIKITWIGAPYNCLWFFTDADYGGTQYVMGAGTQHGAQVPDLPNGIDDRLSSVKPSAALLPAC